MQQVRFSKIRRLGRQLVVRTGAENFFRPQGGLQKILVEGQE